MRNIYGVCLALALSGCTDTIVEGNDDGDYVADPTAGDVADPGDPVAPPPPGDLNPPPPDPQPFVCPASYDLTIPSSSSRYRVITQLASFGTQHADCRDDALGGTHLVAFDTAIELADLVAYGQGQPFYVGAVQQLGEFGPGAGWLIFTGDELPANLWAIDQPNDGDTWESFDEQRGVVDGSGRLHDVAGGTKYRAICECDKQPIAPAVWAALQF